jgi:hypothetical protein
MHEAFTEISNEYALLSTNSPQGFSNNVQSNPALDGHLNTVGYLPLQCHLLNFLFTFPDDIGNSDVVQSDMLYKTYTISHLILFYHLKINFFAEGPALQGQLRGFIIVSSSPSITPRVG